MCAHPGTTRACRRNGTPARAERRYRPAMGWLARRAGRGRRTTSELAVAAPSGRAQLGAAQQHLADFARARTGVEGYIEPATTVTPTTIVLVAGDGEWTRRPVPDARTGERFARDLGVPVFDVNLSGYPSRMREWNARVKAAEAAARRAIDDG